MSLEKNDWTAGWFFIKLLSSSTRLSGVNVRVLGKNWKSTKKGKDWKENDNVIFFWRKVIMKFYKHRTNYCIKKAYSK